MPLSTNQFRLESSILTQAKRATNRNNVATVKRCYIFFWGGFWSGDFIREPQKTHVCKKYTRIDFHLDILSETFYVYAYIFIILDISYLQRPHENTYIGY